MLSLTGASEASFVNREQPLSSITVKKSWVGGHGADSVEVNLLQDGQVIDTKTLNAANDRKYTWSELESGHSYTVEEKTVVPGYTSGTEVEIEEIVNTQTNDLGSGSWWVPATSLTAGNQYMLVSDNLAHALYVSSGHEDAFFDSMDRQNVNVGNGTLTVNGKSYEHWFANTGIDSRSVFEAFSRTKDGVTAIELKCQGYGNGSWLRLENYSFKGTTGYDYTSRLEFKNGYLMGVDSNEWDNEKQWRTIVYDYSKKKFDASTNLTPTNAVKLFVLVNGSAQQSISTTSANSNVVITNTRMPMYHMPETGGTGTTYLYTMGVMLLIAAGLTLYSKKRREEVSGN
ncbi:MAG: Cna B-type domain-containing protein [Clostridia bacterium]|nr:Cna B-type domain-containing protein [Clostridia bacterium]